MDTVKRVVRRNPREQANVFSVLFWLWTIEFFKQGCAKLLKPADLYDPLIKDQSAEVGDRLEKYWNEELAAAPRSKRQPCLWKTLFRCFVGDFIILGLMHIVSKCLRLSTPILIGNLLLYFKEDTDMPYTTALAFAAALCLGNWLNVTIENFELFKGFHIGAKVRTALCSIIYRKTLRLSTRALNDAAPGKVVNLISNDVGRFDMVVVFLHYMWSALIVTIIIGYFSYVLIGYAGLIGCATILILVPIQSYTGKLSAIFRTQTLIRTDERVQLMDEMISGVQVIKMYVWEKAFCSLIAFIRKMELKAIRKKYWVHATFMTCFLFTPRLGLYITLICMMLWGQLLAAEKIFIFFSYLLILSELMGATFVRGITEIAETLVAITRLQEFLMYDELASEKKNCILENLNSSQISDNFVKSSRLPDYQVTASVTDSNSVGNFKKETQTFDNPVVQMTDLTATWNSEKSNSILEDVNIIIERGKLNIVIGAVGCGKSSLVSAILGEIRILQGAVNVRGTISYAGQESWIFGSTIRQNILFGQSYDQMRYQEVIKACALISDFEQFPEGDQTIVGEHGCSLSGGQKARINMARAVYRNADIYILDDPLSAVDAHISNHLFTECIEKYLMGKTRILVTHQLQYIKAADSILLMDSKKLRQFLSFSDFFENGPDYYKSLTTESMSRHNDNSVVSEEGGNKKKSITNQPHITFADQSGSEVEPNSQLNDTLEDSSGGIVQGSVILHYFRAGGNWCLIITVGLLCILSQCTLTVNDMFFPALITADEKRYNDYKAEVANLAEDELPPNSTSLQPPYDYIYIYTSIVISIFVIGMTQSILFYQLCMNASQNLHDSAFGSVIRTGMKFFDTNPSGRILNRFSKDINAIDELLPRTLHDAELIIMIALGGFIIVCTVNPYFLIPLVVLATLTFWLMRLYARIAINVKRLEGVLKSPVFTYLNTSLAGLTTIRAYGAQKILMHEFDAVQDNHSSAWYMFLVTNAAFGFYLDTFCCSFITIVTFTLLMINQYSKAEVGLAITVIISMTAWIRWGMRQSAEVVNQMTCVERVLEYKSLVPENNLDSSKGLTNFNDILNENRKQSGDSSKNWPQAGHIEFRNVYLRYVENEPPVLNGLNIVIKPREKIGIVGRSGAGKSSIISALFRLRDVEGVLEIDDVNIQSMPAQKLRKCISIIPQNPVLFSGTLRKNLDPFNECSDDDLWTVLEEVELKDTVTTSSGDGLESRVLHRGANFSSGQKQLVCLARAILRNNTILILDEATANVDPYTDELIQRTIRTKFSSCTVLTVAHRLNTIMDSDKVLVMDQGQIMEFDHPHTLLQNPQGHFSALVRETGAEMSEQLCTTAKQAYDNRKV